MFHPLLAEPRLSAASVLAPTVDLLVDRLGWSASYIEQDGSCCAVLDLAGRSRIFISAIDEAPSESVAANARRALVGQSVPSAAIVLYPDLTSRWRSSPLVYVAWRHGPDVGGVELAGARLALSDDGGVLVMAESGEGLLVGGGLCYARCAYSEPDDRWRALLAGAAAWQDRVVRYIWQEAA